MSSESEAAAREDSQKVKPPKRPDRRIRQVGRRRKTSATPVGKGEERESFSPEAFGGAIDSVGAFRLTIRFGTPSAQTRRPRPKEAARLLHR